MQSVFRIHGLLQCQAMNFLNVNPNRSKVAQCHWGRKYKLHSHTLYYTECECCGVLQASTTDRTQCLMSDYSSTNKVVGAASDAKIIVW